MVTASRWNVLEHLDNEEEITGFLQAVIDEGGAAQFPRALVNAAQARIINQLAKETGADRKALCAMFSDGEGWEPSREVVEKLARSFSVPVPV